MFDSDDTATSQMRRYSIQTLLKLRDSPLVTKPDGLPNIAELMSTVRGKEPKPNDGTAKAETGDNKPRNHSKSHAIVEKVGEADLQSLRSKSSLPGASRTADKTGLVLGPPKMSFVSAQSTGIRSPEGAEMKTGTGAKATEDFPRPPKYSVAERIAARGSKDSSESDGSRPAGILRSASISERSSHRNRYGERHTTRREIEYPGRETDRSGNDHSFSRPQKSEGSWRDRSEGAAPAARSLGKAVQDIRAPGQRRGNRDNQPEWMTADAQKMKFETATTSTFENAARPEGEDDIQRFKARMKRQEQLAKGQNREPSAENSQCSSLESDTQLRKPPENILPSARKVNDDVDTFLDMTFDFSKVDVSQLFESAPRSENDAGAEGKQQQGAGIPKPSDKSASRFARFWAAESGIAAPETHSTDDQIPESETMQRIGISDLFNGSAKSSPIMGRSFIANNTQLSGPQVMSEDDVISSYRAKQRNSFAQEKSAFDGLPPNHHPLTATKPPVPGREPAVHHRGPSAEDRAGINRVMEKLAFFGIGQGHERAEPAMHPGFSHPPHPSHRLIAQDMRLVQERPMYFSQPPHSLARDEPGRPQPQSLYRSTINVGLPEDPTSQLAAMIQAASKAKQNQHTSGHMALNATRLLPPTAGPEGLPPSHLGPSPSRPSSFALMGRPIPGPHLNPNIPGFATNGDGIFPPGHAPFIPPHMLPPQPPFTGNVPPYGMPRPQYPGT